MHVDEYILRDIVRWVAKEHGFRYAAAVDWIIETLRKVAQKEGWNKD